MSCLGIDTLARLLHGAAAQCCSHCVSQRDESHSTAVTARLRGRKNSASTTSSNVEDVTALLRHVEDLTDEREMPVQPECQPEGDDRDFEELEPMVSLPTAASAPRDLPIPPQDVTARSSQSLNEGTPVVPVPINKSEK